MIINPHVATPGLTSVPFADSSVGIIVGGYSTVLRTQDGGAAWSLVSDDLSRQGGLGDPCGSLRRAG